MSTQTTASNHPDAPLSILLIEDSPEDAFTIGRSLEKACRPRFSLETTGTWSAGRVHLESGKTDVVLLDLHLPDADGLDLVRDVIQSASDVPIVVLTGIDDDQIALEALQLGAQDYLVKSDIGTNTLRRSIYHAIERQQILASLQRANEERIRLKDELLCHVSHELLTPLSAIYQFVEILNGTLDEPAEVRADKQRMCIDVLSRNAIQLRHMIGDLMEATRLDTGKLTLDLRALDLCACIDLAVQSAGAAAARKKLSLTFEWPSELPCGIADEKRLRQVADNLLSNAIKFTPESGRISVRIDRFERDPGYAHVVVEDTGPGVSEEARTLIFERLYQDNHSLRVSRKGIGIGLYICREVVRRMGGEIWVESRVGEGSSFQFTVPLYSTERLLRDRVDATRPLSLIEIALWSGEPAGGDRVDALACDVYDEVGRLVWNRCDIVLPPRPLPGPVQQIAVLAQTGADGAQAMRARIERTLRARLPEMAASVGVDVAASTRFTLDAPIPSTAELAGRVDRALADSIRASASLGNVAMVSRDPGGEC